jgi:hypothetical protein
MILDLVVFHQMGSQALICVRPHLIQYPTGIAIMEVVCSPAKGSIHASDNVFQRNWRALSCSQLRYTIFDFAICHLTATALLTPLRK